MTLDKPRRRFWSDDQKRRIVAETYAPGVSVSVVANRYDLNPNLVFVWRRDPRFNLRLEAEPTFLPVTLETAPIPATRAAPITPEPASEPRTCPSSGTVEVTLPCRSRVVCHGDVDSSLVLDVLARLQSQR